MVKPQINTWNSVLLLYKNDITSIPKNFWMNRSEFKFWCDCWLANLTLDKIDQRFVWSHDVSFENAIIFSVISVQIVTDNGRRIDVIFWGCCPHNSMRTKQGSGYVSGSSTKILLIDNSIKTPVYSQIITFYILSSKTFWRWEFEVVLWPHKDRWCKCPPKCNVCKAARRERTALPATTIPAPCK